MADRITVAGVNQDLYGTESYFAGQEAVDLPTYQSSFVNFYNQFLDIPSLTDTGIDVGGGDDITELEEYGIAGEQGDRGDTQDDAINALEATGIRSGESMFPGGTGISYNTDLETGHHQYNNYSDYIKAENPPGMKDRLGFIENVMEPFVQGNWSDINLSAGFSSQLNSTMENMEAAVDPTKVSGKTAMKGLFSAVSAPMALVGSAVFSDKTVKNAFGEISARPDGMLGIVADAVHSRQYNDRSINRAVMAAHTTGPMAGQFMTAGDEETDAYGNPVASSRGLTGVDIGFSMQFGSGVGSGGITRRAGTAVYTGNMRGLDNSTLKNMEAIQRGFVPSTFGGTFGFDYTGKDAVRFEDAGYSNDLGNGGRYTNNGSYMDGYGRTSAYGRASDLEALAKTNGITVDQAKSVLDKARSGKGTVAQNIQSIKNEKAAAEAAKKAAEQAAKKAAEKAAQDRADRESFNQSFGDDGGSGGFSESESGQISDAFGGGDARGGRIEHGRPQNLSTENNRQNYAFGTPPAGVQASQSGFIDAPPSQVTEGAKVADNRPDSVPEGTYIINAAAVEFAGEQDIRKMIMDAQKEAVRRGLSTDNFERHSNLVDIAVSSGEVKIAPHLVDIIGEDRLEKINKRGIRKTEQRIAENGQQPVGAAEGGFIDRKKFAAGDKVTLYRGEPLDPSKVVATDYGYGKEDVGKFHTPDVKRAGRFAADAGKGNQVIKSRKVTIDQLFEGVEEAWKTQGKKKTEYFAKMPKSELDKNLRFVRELKRAYLAGERSLDDMAMFLQEQVFHDDKSKINFIETFKNDPKSAGKLAGRAIAKVATVATPPLAVLASAAEMLTPSSLGKGTMYDDSFMNYEFTPSK
jgi:hypothetical protein